MEDHLYAYHKGLCGVLQKLKALKTNQQRMVLARSSIQRSRRVLRDLQKPTPRRKRGSTALLQTIREDNGGTTQAFPIGQL